MNWPDMEQNYREGSCECCGKPWSETMRPELTARCHTGPVFVSYCSRFLYVECGVCRKPICKIPVDGRLV